MLNGDTLKVVFMAIVGTLCLILVVLTIAVLAKHFSVDDYKQTLEVLGIPTFFGMIGQSFIHFNQNGGSNEKSTVDSNVSPVASVVAGPDGTK